MFRLFFIFDNLFDNDGQIDDILDDVLIFLILIKELTDLPIGLGEQKAVFLRYGRLYIYALHILCAYCKYKI